MRSVITFFITRALNFGRTCNYKFFNSRNWDSLHWFFYWWLIVLPRTLISQKKNIYNIKKEKAFMEIIFYHESIKRCKIFIRKIWFKDATESYWQLDNVELDRIFVEGKINMGDHHAHTKIGQIDINGIEYHHAKRGFKISAEITSIFGSE